MTREGLLDARNAKGKDFVYAVLTIGMYVMYNTPSFTSLIFLTLFNLHIIYYLFGL
jgi:hypothetical protein